MIDKNKRYFWIITGIIWLTSALAFELSLQDLGLPAPIPVYWFLVALASAYCPIPGLLMILAPSILLTVLYIITLSCIENEWVPSTQAGILMLNAIAFVVLGGTA